MKRFVCSCLLLLAGLAAPCASAEWAWAMSVPHAISDKYVYKVRVLAIDGKPQPELLRYSLNPGMHELTVELLLDLEWEPDLRAGEPAPPVKSIEIEAESGKSYLLAGKVDVSAPAESQLDGSYWAPIVYAVK